MNRPIDPAVEAAEAGRFVAKRIARSNSRRRRGRRRVRAPPDDDDGDGGFDACSIREFCWRHDISEAFYHKLRALGLGPATMKVGSRVLISKEAAAAWRRKRERAAAAEAASIRSEA